MPDRPKRSATYREIADTLTESCMRSIDESGRSTVDALHGSPSVGHVAYALGELHRCRPALDLESLHGRNLISIMRSMIEHRLDLDNEIHRCFLGMGLGMMGPADDNHPVLDNVPESQRRLIRDGLVVTREFDHNWEAFNGSILAGRHLLYGDPAEAMVVHFEKIARKYDETGYFDDSLNLGNYNNYGFMSLNYPLRASEYLAQGHPVREVIEDRFKEHAVRYVNLVRALVSPSGDTWPFGRSAGVLGQLQCVVLMEQCLSKKWIADEHVNQVRAISRQATKRMLDLYWDENLHWFNFRDEYQTAYDYRASHPMAWDMLRYFLQVEEYAAADDDSGNPERDAPVHNGPAHQEIVTNPKLKTAIYVWSDGADHAVVPIMAGPHRVTGDSLARPYAQGLFEWTTQLAIPALCPKLTIEGENYWPSWHAGQTTLEVDGDDHVYDVLFNRLHSDTGEVCDHSIACETRFVFVSRQFERVDSWTIQEPVEIEYSLEVLQPAPHPQRPRFADVHQLSVTWESEVEAIRLNPKEDVSRDPDYRNYHGHASHSWKIGGSQIRLEPGTYATTLQLRW